MKNTVMSYLKHLRQDRSRRRKLGSILVCLSLIVASGTVWALHITGESKTGATYCGLEEHQHDDTCMEKTLVCGYDETASEHTHTDECYEITYTCGSEEHTHTLSCYSNPDADVETAEIWEQTVANVELTGNYADDVLIIAKTQLGYTESTENFATATDETGEEYITGGYTRYGDWYGDRYGEWNAMFVSFCLNYANVPTTAFPQDSACASWMATLSDESKGYELYRAAADYSPYPGDLVFFDTDADGTADRVGIVSELTPEYTGTEENYEDDADYTLTGFKAIEGDSDNQVAENAYELTDETILGYGALSLVYGTAAQEDSYIELDSTVTVSKVDSLLLWIHSATSGGSIVVNRGSDNPITDALTYTDTDSNVYYLVPITYFNEVEDQLEYFTFDENNCPFVYAPSAYYPSADLTDAVYVKYKESWYVRVQDTSGVTPNRSNIYYDVSKEVGDYFTLTYNNVELQVYVMDSSGNPIYGNYSDYNMTLEGAKKYLFEADDSDTTSTPIPIPTIEDYTYSSTHIQAYNGASVVSVATSGYPLNDGTGKTLDRNFRFYNNGGTDANGGYYTKDSETIYLVYAPDMHVITDVASANSTAVNLFDYWCTTQDGSDYHQSDDSAGINADHALKFHYSSSDNTGTFNKWTGSGGGVLQGIVQSSLDKGFPALSGNTSLGMETTDTESLAYLFDPSKDVTVDGTSYKASYRNVQGLFQIDSNGYFYYDAKQNFAEYNEDTNRFTLYEESGVANSDTSGSGMFFPFNTIEEAYPLSSGENATLNHYFGMALTTRFVQTYEGHTDASRETANTFQFAGDDDVWIFIDDVLVADLGGIHDAVGVTINFAEGTVVTNTVYGATSNPVTTQFSDIFDSTSVQLETYTNNGKSYTTLANNTTHTLKFFYLERGNAASNLYLRYNLNEIPDTSIYKVDQYGYALAGATFAVYPSNEDSQYVGTTTTEDGTETTEYISLADCTQVYSADSVEKGTYYIDPATGDITANVGGTEYTIKAAYCGTTDSQGEMSFVDGDGMPYSASELKGMFGEYFILREVDVPDGYRTVEDEVLLQFVDELLQSVDPYGTGVWASPNALVTATNTLHIADNYGNTDSNLAKDAEIEYYNPTTGTTNGTLFAVILKRNTGDNTTITSDDVPTWQPVYGSDDEGYEVLSFGGEDTYGTQLEAVIAAAKLADECGNVEFSYAASGMQVLLKNLPGKATRYYTYMLEHGDPFTTTEPQYLIAYYYTTADNLSGADTTNTVRVRSHGQTKTDGTSTTTYDAFTTQWGADIEVPNIENRLFFQKQDENGNFVENAVFALYPVVEIQTTIVGGVTTANYYYTATAADESTAYVRLDVNAKGETSYGTATVYTTSDNQTNTTEGTYTIQSGTNKSDGYITDSGAGYITVTAGGTIYTIKPATNAVETSMVGFTHDDCTFVSEKGTGHFRQLTNGYYILREIEAPAGYEVNHEEIKVIVNDTAVYANAGTTDNGVAVGNGVGYVVRTLDVFASEGKIDESLTWIYSMLRVNPNNNSFSGVDIANTPYYVMQDGGEADGYGSGTTKDRSEAMVTYLKYVEGEDERFLFDYAVNNNEDENGIVIGQKARAAVDGTASIATLEGEGTMRLYTTAGWSALEVYQDYAYGSVYTAATTNYDDLSGQNLTNLYSNSTFVRVTDQYSVGDLEISKTVLPDTKETFSFKLDISNGTDMVTTLGGTYYYQIYDVTTDDDGNEVQTKVTSESDITVNDVSYSGKIDITTTKDDEGNIISQTGSATVELKNNQIVVIENLPYGTEYTVTETLPADSTLPYTTWISVNDTDKTESTERTNSGTLVWRTDVTDRNVYNVDYTNALLPLVEIVKVDSANDETTLAGAQFVMYRVTGEGENQVTEYYSDGNWVTMESGKTEADYAQTTTDNGVLLFANMNKDGTYYLKEIAAPNGYNMLTEVIEFKVATTNGEQIIVSPTEDDSSEVYQVTDTLYDGKQLNVTINNTSGYELPYTGGAGTTLFTLGGLLLIAVTLVYGCGLRRRRERRTR